MKATEPGQYTITVLILLALTVANFGIALPGELWVVVLMVSIAAALLIVKVHNDDRLYLARLKAITGLDTRREVERALGQTSWCVPSTARTIATRTLKAQLELMESWEK